MGFERNWCKRSSNIPCSLNFLITYYHHKIIFALKILTIRFCVTFFWLSVGIFAISRSSIYSRENVQTFEFFPNPMQQNARKVYWTIRIFLIGKINYREYTENILFFPIILLKQNCWICLILTVNSNFTALPKKTPNLLIISLHFAIRAFTTLESSL